MIATIEEHDVRNSAGTQYTFEAYDSKKHQEPLMRLATKLYGQSLLMREMSMEGKQTVRKDTLPADQCFLGVMVPIAHDFHGWSKRYVIKDGEEIIGACASRNGRYVTERYAFADLPYSSIMAGLAKKRLKESIDAKLSE